MKSRIVFLCTLAAFLSPMSVLAFESSTHSDCWKWQQDQMAKKLPTEAIATVTSTNTEGKKTDQASNGG